MSGKREFGDYQTPQYFAIEIGKYLKEVRGINPSVIIEPTCGTGSFIKAATLFDAKTIAGIEINKEYCEICQNNNRDPRVVIKNADFFTIDMQKLIRDKENILVLGNPPWVTNSELSSLCSSNIPPKNNFKKLSGLEALTGSSNFDICEYIILSIATALQHASGTIAMLCKTTVARSVFKEMKRSGMSFSTFDILEFDANKVFGISAKACLLVVEFIKNADSPESFGVFSLDNPENEIDRIVYSAGSLYNQTKQRKYDFWGKSNFEWRQGVKHDCSKIMELSYDGESFTNGLGEFVEIEPDYVYPLIKSSMFKSAIITNSSKYVIVTQKKIKEDTTHIYDNAPRTWEYLQAHKKSFEKRKSSIYRNAPAFSVFGIGDYSYAQYKVGVSGFYKKPLFSLMCSEDNRPIMADDTSYFICLPSFDTAYTAMLILNSDLVQTFLCSIAFLDSKRPFTKKVLEKIDFHKVLNVIQPSDLRETEERLGLEHRVTEKMLDEFRELSELGQVSMPLYGS